MLAPADITEIDQGLWRWTARHPGWTAGARPESPADWPAEVGSVAFAAADALVLIDPLVPEGAEGLWAWLDERAAASGGTVSVLTTLPFHARSSSALVRRYGPATRAVPPAGVEPIPLAAAGETMFWIPSRRTLIPGDRIIGAARGGELRMCPESWLAYLGPGVSLAHVREELLALLKLPVERVLVSHGAPVLAGGSEALARAIEAP